LLALFYVSIYLKDLASIWIGNSFGGRIAFFALVFGFLGFLIIGKLPDKTVGRNSIFLLITWFLIWIFSALVTGGNFNFSSYYIVIPCAFLIVNTNLSLFIRILLVHLSLTVAIEFWEYLSGHYMFVYEADDGTLLNEALLGRDRNF